MNKTHTQAAEANEKTEAEGKTRHREKPILRSRGLRGGEGGVELNEEVVGGVGGTN